MKITDHRKLKYDRNFGEHKRIFLGIKGLCNGISENGET